MMRHIPGQTDEKDFDLGAAIGQCGAEKLVATPDFIPVFERYKDQFAHESVLLASHGAGSWIFSKDQIKWSGVFFRFQPAVNT